MNKTEKVTELVKKYNELNDKADALKKQFKRNAFTVMTETEKQYCKVVKEMNKVAGEINKLTLKKDDERLASENQIYELEYNCKNFKQFDKFVDDVFNMFK